MSIYQEFTPTHLYIKQHTVTGKLYFGKTIQNPEKYPGSGSHWKNHIKKHGKNHTTTLWYELFTDKEEIQKFALSFSQDMNIVESEQWLNKKPENGLDGNTVGNFHKPESIKLMRDAKLGKKASLETKRLLKEIRKGEGNSMYGKRHTEESKLQMSINRKGKHKNGVRHSIETKEKMSISALNRNPVSLETKDKLREKIKCPHCGILMHKSNAKRYHFDNCKFKL